jgi:hypothetical protein
MVDPANMPELPDLEEFARRVDEAAASAERFADASGVATNPVATGGGQQAQQPMDMSVFRDILSALSMIHDDTTAIRESLNQIAGT